MKFEAKRSSVQDYCKNRLLVFYSYPCITRPNPRKEQLTGELRPMALCDGGHQLNVFGLPLRDSEHSCRHFASDDVDRTHIVISSFEPIFTIKHHLLILGRVAQGAQMQYFLHLLMGNVIYSWFPFDGCSGLIIERLHTRIASKFSPILETGKIVGGGDDIRDNEQSYAFSLDDQVEGPADIQGTLDQSPNFLLQVLYLHFKGFNHPDVSFEQSNKVTCIQESALFLGGDLKSSFISHQPVTQGKKRLPFDNSFYSQFCKPKNIPMSISVFHNPSSVDLIILSPCNSQRLFDLKRRGHRAKDFPYFKIRSQRKRIKPGVLKTDHCPGVDQITDQF
jgi:hypothetical protein